jgi:protein tyrosine/serine phosphatase
LKKKNPIRRLIIILLIATACVLLIRHFRIRHFHIIGQGVLYTSGQPRGMDYTRLLYKYHIATIVNLRSPAEHREQNWYNEEMTWVRTNGVKYIEIPIDKDVNSPRHFPDPNLQQQFLKIMADRENLPVLVHDSKGETRVALMAAVWLAKSQRASVEQILVVAEQIKNEPLAELETGFIRSLSK